MTASLFTPPSVCLRPGDEHFPLLVSEVSYKVYAIFASMRVAPPRRFNLIDADIELLAAYSRYHFQAHNARLHHGELFQVLIASSVVTLGNGGNRAPITATEES